MSAGSFPPHALASPLLERMVFVVGVPRSGTNWIGRILASHPDVVVLPSETHLFSHGFAALAEQVQHGLVGSSATGTVYLPRAEFLSLLREFADRAFGAVARATNAGARLVAERSPHHVWKLPLIGAVYPDARVLHVLRDGRDVTRSLVAMPWGPASVAEAAAQWDSGVRAGQAAAPALDAYRELRYESVLADPGAAVREVFGWLGLAADDEQVAAALLEAAVEYNVDASRPTVGVGKWRADWDREDLEAFAAAAGALLAELGYDAASVPAPAPTPPSAPARPVRRRRLLRGARALSAAGPGGPAKVTPGPASRAGLPLEAAQGLVDSFLGHAAAGEYSALAGLATDDVEVVFRTATESWRGRGPVAMDRLVTALGRDEPAGWGRAVRGEQTVTPGGGHLAVLTHVAPGSPPVDRVLMCRLAGLMLAEIRYYRFPLGEP